MPATTSTTEDLDHPLHPGAGLQPPAIPAARLALPRHRFRFYPKLQRESDHPTAWHFPAFLDDRTPWVAMLKELYASPLTFPASMSPETGLLLHSIVRNIRPRTVIEIGTFIGVSTIWIGSALAEAITDPDNTPIAQGQPRGIIHCFDDFGPIAPGPWRNAALTDRPRVDVVREHLTRAGLADRAILHQGDSSVEILKLAEQLRWGPAGKPPAASSDPAAFTTSFTGGVDFAMIDGDHTPAGVLQDLWAVEPLLNVGGYLFLHDIFPEQCAHAGPRHLLDRLLRVAQGLYEPCEIYTAPLNYGVALLRRVG